MFFSYKNQIIYVLYKKPNHKFITTIQEIFDFSHLNI